MRLIDPNALKKAICDDCVPDCKRVCPLTELIDAQPEIKAKPVRHGHWKWDDGYVGTQAVCSICGKSPLGFYALPKNQIGRLPEYPYCPRCGAKMDGGTKNEYK